MADPILYTIYCILPHDTDPFPIEIAQNGTVIELTVAINDLMQLVPKKDAEEILLHHADIPDDDDLEERVNQLLNTRPMPKTLRQSYAMSDIFPNAPRKRTVHIVVRVPELRQSPGRELFTSGLFSGFIFSFSPLSPVAPTTLLICDSIGKSLKRHGRQSGQSIKSITLLRYVLETAHHGQGKPILANGRLATERRGLP